MKAVRRVVALASILSALAAILTLAFATFLFAPARKPDNPDQHRGKVVDALTMKPIEGAFVTLGGTVVRTNNDGTFQIQGSGDLLRVRAYGYWRAEAAASTHACDASIVLKPFMPKALYLSFYGIGDKRLRESALGLIRDTELNALVIDVKGDRGMVAFKSTTPLASEVGAQKIITINDIGALVRDLHAKGIYLIARIVVFKDDRLATKKPELAVRTRGGAIWKDREGLAWTSPFLQSVWDYNIDIAVEAARAGFDEIQFDYLRFPDTPGGLAYTMSNTQSNRVMAITGFLVRARTRLIPSNVFLAADIFGYVAWNADDTRIGQRIEYLASVLDYVSPMLYPSGYQFGIPGYPNPVQHPREVVGLTLEKARKRTGKPALRFRPWLQAFRDYAFGGVPYQGREIRMQIDAAEDFGSDGWMLWNPKNIYDRNGLKPK